MPRWNYDVTFYRMFCITLLAIAFIFTVILTNVFIDIDGLLSIKDKASKTADHVFNDVENQVLSEGEATEVFYNDNNYIDDNSNWSYRTKRSLDSNHKIFKNPKIKKLLTHHIASLLEELDEQDKLDDTLSEKTLLTNKNELNGDIMKENIRKNKDLLHLAIHNILYKGITAHADLHDVYKKIHLLLKSWDKDYEKVLMKIIESKEISEESSDIHTDESRHLEVTKSKKRDVVTGSTQTNIPETKDRNLIIKSIIEIWDQDANKQVNISSENVHGLIKLLYNGKEITFSQLNDYPNILTTTEKIKRKLEEITISAYRKANSLNVKKTNGKYDKTILNKQIDKVLKGMLENYSITDKVNEENSSETLDSKFTRNKRQVAIHYIDDEMTSSRQKPIRNKNKSNDDDLYVEIETHFDEKDAKDDKKKKFVKDIVNKIQVALADQHSVRENQEKHLEYKKRFQNPIDMKEYPLFNSQIISPLETIEQRQVGPINKILNQHHHIFQSPEDNDPTKFYPSFLTVSKAVNSAELGKIEVNYDEVLRNGIPKRLQEPLTASDKEKDDIPTNIFTDLGNITVLLKDIDGTGFSIGFNKYVDEPPDKESLKIFSGLENLLKEYRNMYDGGEASNELYNNNIKNFVQNIHEVTKRDVKIQPNVPQFHVNKNMEKQIDQLKMQNNLAKIVSNKQLGKSIKLYPKYVSLNEPIVIKEKILKKTFIPSEFFSLPDILKRKKRSLNIQKFKDLKSKIKLNKFINTNAMSKRKIFMKNKRNKRQINKVRIITKDPALSMFNYSDENVLFLSDEDTVSDKMLPGKESEFQDMIIDKNARGNYLVPIEDISSIPSSRNIYTENLYGEIPHRDNLMSKYPHIFLENMPATYREFSDERHNNYRNSYRIQATPNYQNNFNSEFEATTIVDDSYLDRHTSGIAEIISAVLSPVPKTHYKVTLKILPKQNMTKIENTGYKEIHTTVNKSYAKNGMQYVTLFNLTKMSKIERLNTTTNKNILSNNNNKETKLRSLLNSYKKRVDQQLNNLIIESKNLDYIFNAYQNSEISGVPINIDLNHSINDKNYRKTTQVNYDIINAKLNDNVMENTTKPNIKMNIKSDDEKIQILKTIKHNENITNEILKRIDKNTLVMQNILQQLSEHLNSKMRMTTTTDKILFNPNKKIENKLFLDNSRRDIRRHKFFDEFNDFSNNSKTFFNTYKSKFEARDKKIPLASVLYHGEVFANTIGTLNPNNLIKSPIAINNEKENSNKTSAFH